MSRSKKITLKSSGGVAFTVDEAVALESQTIKHVIEDVCVDNGIPLPNVTTDILRKVIVFCQKHVDASKAVNRAITSINNDLKAWDAEFVRVNLDTLFDIILAADYLNIKSLLDLTCQTVEDKITGKTSEEICEIFKIKNNFTPKKEEEAFKKITFKSSDGEAFEVDEVVALEFQTIKHMIEDDCADNTIPLPNVTSKILSKVIEYCQKHVEASKAIDFATTSADLKDWDADFVKLDQATLLALIFASKASEHAVTSINNDLKAWDADFVKVDVDTLIDIILAANYLEIKSLLDLTCQAIADLIRGKTPDEIKKIFNIKNEFTPEEEEQIRRENQWTFE